MLKKVFVLLFFVLLSCASTQTMGQDFSALREKAEELVKAKRPDLQLRSRTEERDQVVYSWGEINRGIGLLIFYGASEKDAIERMKLTNKFLSVGPGKKRTGFGNEAFSSESPKGDFARLRFRKDNVYVEIGAPTLAMAEELAKDIAKSIKKK